MFSVNSQLIVLFSLWSPNPHLWAASCRRCQSVLQSVFRCVASPSRLRSAVGDAQLQEGSLWILFPLHSPASSSPAIPSLAACTCLGQNRELSWTPLPTSTPISNKHQDSSTLLPKIFLTLVRFYQPPLSLPLFRPLLSLACITAIAGRLILICFTLY